MNRATLGLLAAAFCAPAIADLVTRLAPAEFTQAPPAVRATLARLGCTVPQSFSRRAPHNVIAGSFTRPGARQWAVLCSTDGSSEVLIFDAASSAPLFRLAKAPDEIFLQVTAPGRTVYSRRIDAGLSSVPGLNSIHDAFIEKASVVWIYADQRWIEKAGAD